MAAYQPSGNPPDDFVLEFSKVIETAVIRKGGERCPIVRLPSDRFMKESEYIR